MQAAVLDGAVTLSEASLLQSLAEAADERRTSARRGRAGLTAPAVVEFVTRYRTVPARTERRRASSIIDRLANFAREQRIIDGLRDYVATHDLPPMGLADFLEAYLWDHIDEYAAEFRESA